MSNEIFTAAASVLTALFTVFGVKLLDTLAGRQTKRFDELALIRQSQQTRIESLETKLEAKEREFDEYQRKTNERFDKMNEELYKLRTENVYLNRMLERYHAEGQANK